MKPTVLLAALAVAAFPAAASALTLDSRTVMKVADSGPGTFDPYLDWIGSGGFNEGVAGAADPVNNGLDYKDSWADTNWNEAVTARVSVFSGGQEVAFILFDAAGTTKSDVFSAANVIGSTWTDLGDGGNHFSIAGDAGLDRHWFVNNSYGGCASDVGQLLLLDGRTGACPWESSRSGAGLADRAFLYSAASTEVNWTTGNIGVGDVFMVSVEVPGEEPPRGEIPLPASAAFAVAGLGALGWLRGRRRKG